MGSRKPELKTAHPGMIWVIEVEYKRRKGRPVEPVALTTGGMLQALFLAKECAQRLKVPESWAKPTLYRKADLLEAFDGETTE